ncbi:phospholipase D-like domain-containing protein [Holophaga foetida]|uniref:phospholipase D-like domain-containing protein n=1 Tax=Holophaga foetida TaxID=35839 RepID=UPI0002473EEE|nr:phosphatidylserine/phosphatidylglycerophosphate/cardiolipin synthase family protein [Holophaga foetida]
MSGPIQSLWRRLQAHGARNSLPASDGNAVQLLESGCQILEASRNLIRGATRTLHFETYIWTDDQTGRELLELLKDAQTRGVQVRGIVDHFGSWASEALIQEARKAGLNVRLYHPIRIRFPWRSWMRRNHRKLVIADGRRAVVGSANWADDYNSEVNPNHYRDLGLELMGPVMKDLSLDFAASWTRAKGQPFSTEDLPASTEELPSQAWIPRVPIQVVSSLNRGRQPIRRHLLVVLRQVKQRALVASAYFVPDPQVLRALTRMIRRGVETDLILPGTSDHPAVQAASRATFGRLLRVGARIWERQGRMLHTKAAVLDQEIVILGSANLDSLSFRRNLELNLVLRSRTLAGIIEETLERDRSRSLPWDLEQWHALPFWRKTLQRVFYALWPWL